MIRLLNDTDRPMVEDWVRAEPTHGNNTFAWYSESGARTVVVEDEAGPVIVAKFTPILQMDTDFLPEADPKRVARAIIEGLTEIEKQAKAQGFRGISFESVAEKLISFCRKLGYRASPGYRKVL